jgi:hypothetical protein
MTPESPAGFSVAEAEQPIYFGRYVLYRGRVMPLVAGGESNGAPAAAGDGGAGGAGDGGDGGSGPIPWDLSSVSEELRPHVEAALKGVEGGVTKRFQEHADFRKQWEPYAGVEGLSEISPEDMARLVAFHQTASDEQQFEQWLRAVAQEFGITGEQPQTPAPGDGEPPDTNAALQKMFDDFTGKLEERFAPIEQFMGTSEASQREQAVRAEIDSAIADIVGDGEAWPDDKRESVLQLAHAYPSEMPLEETIQKAHQDYLRIRGEAQSELVDPKQGGPGPTVNGGRPDTAPQEFEGLDDPKLKQAALTRMRGATATT